MARTCIKLCLWTTERKRYVRRTHRSEDNIKVDLEKLVWLSEDSNYMVRFSSAVFFNVCILLASDDGAKCDCGGIIGPEGMGDK